MIKINIQPGQNIFFTSDPHYNHTNLCKGVSKWDNSRPGKIRDFKDLGHMNSTIVNNINSMVGENDILFCFGDWSFGGVEQIWEFRKQIVCKNIYLFFGNHDHHIIDNKILPNVSEHKDFDGIFNDFPNPNNYGDDRDRMWDISAQQLFTWVGYYGNFELVFPQTKKNEPAKRFKFVGCHYPIASWEEMGRGRIHLHGHTHLDQRDKLHQGKSIDVGLDGNNYQVYSLKDIENLMNKQPISPTTLKFDHHIENT